MSSSEDGRVDHWQVSASNELRLRRLQRRDRTALQQVNASVGADGPFDIEVGTVDAAATIGKVVQLADLIVAQRRGGVQVILDRHLDRPLTIVVPDLYVLVTGGEFDQRALR